MLKLMPDGVNDRHNRICFTLTYLTSRTSIVSSFQNRAAVSMFTKTNAYKAKEQHQAKGLHTL